MEVHSKNSEQFSERLLALRRDGFDPARLRIEDFIAPRAMGEANTIHGLQNYIIGLSPDGLMLDDDGRLDLARSFRRLDYFSLFQSLRTRNNVQPAAGNQPVDFVAARVPLMDSDGTDSGAVNYAPKVLHAKIFRSAYGNAAFKVK